MKNINFPCQVRWANPNTNNLSSWGYPWVYDATTTFEKEQPIVGRITCPHPFFHIYLDRGFSNPNPDDSTEQPVLPNCSILIREIIHTIWVSFGCQISKLFQPFTWINLQIWPFQSLTFRCEAIEPQDVEKLELAGYTLLPQLNGRVLQGEASYGLHQNLLMY